MSEIQFEPFGEQILKYSAASSQTSLQSAVSRTGMTVFWTLVAGIVMARAFYFNPDFGQNFVAVVLNGAHAVLGG